MPDTRTPVAGPLASAYRLTTTMVVMTILNAGVAFAQSRAYVANFGVLK